MYHDNDDDYDDYNDYGDDGKLVHWHGLDFFRLLGKAYFLSTRTYLDTDSSDNDDDNIFRKNLISQAFWLEWRLITDEKYR